MTDDPKKPKRPRDTNQLAKFIVDVATGEVDESGLEHEKPEGMAALGRLGGLKGGKARSAALSPAERSEIARKAARSRWEK